MRKMKQDERKYYEAYEDRYKTVHARGVSWSSDACTPIVLQTLEKYRIDQRAPLLEIGCGEGRDARAVLDGGYCLTATDASSEAVLYCKKQMPQYARCFRVLDCLSDELDGRYAFIYAVAVVHMLVLDSDRDGFYRFLREHLSDGAIALICTMGDGETEYQSDIGEAFTLKERDHESGRLSVAATSCRTVSFQSLERELERNRLSVVEKGIVSSPPDFDRLMYAVVTAS